MKLWLRNGLYLAAILLLFPWLLIRRWRTGRYRQGLKHKLCGLSAEDLPEDFRFGPTGNPSEVFWVHGVSVGEVQLLAPLVKLLQQQRPHALVAVSTTTDSGMELLSKLLPDTLRFYFPLDFSWAIRRTLRTLRPTKVVLVELELWPNLIDLAAAADVPLIVINGRLSEKSFRRYRALALITQGMFRKLSAVVAQSTLYAERFRHCGCAAQSVRVAGSLKFDNVDLGHDSPQVAALSKLVGLESEDRVWIAGSTQAPEELTCCNAFLSLRQQWPRLKLIVVPRHPDRFDAIFQSLGALPAKVRRRSEVSDPLQSSDWEILLVDTVGELRWWWGLAEIALVGGSFGNRGGQNMLEPAAYGANVAFGPNTANFRDIVELLLAGEAACRISNLDGIEDWVRGQLEQPEAGRQRGQRAREIIAAHQGATAQTLELILASGKK